MMTTPEINYEAIIERLRQPNGDITELLTDAADAIEQLLQENIDLIKYRTLLVYRGVGIMCIALAHYPGDAWGRKRLARLLLGAGGAGEMLARISEIADWKLCRELRRIGMPEIADTIVTLSDDEECYERGA